MSRTNSGKAIKLSPRLTAAVSYIRKGATVADIGSDHCYIPIWLLQEGVTERIIATDINSGPLEKAVQNLGAYRMSGRVTLVQCDGLQGIEAYRPDDILICGMGGELIADIIAASDYTRQSGVSLILQPMTKSDVLRRYLCDNGYETDGETLAAEDKIYEIIHAHYDGAKHDYSMAEYLIGRRNIENRQECFGRFLMGRIAYVRHKSDGMAYAGIDNSEQLELLRQLKEIESKI